MWPANFQNSKKMGIRFQKSILKVVQKIDIKKQIVTELHRIGPDMRKLFKTFFYKKKNGLKIVRRYRFRKN